MLAKAALVGVTLFLVAATASHAQPSLVPAKYRYTGWLVASEQSSGWPTHLLIEGDGGTLRFADRWNLTKIPTVYKVCVKRLGAHVASCKAATAPVSTRPSLVPIFVLCCGDFVARWYVSGRLVASWPFRYAPEHA
jgi:hypothetical protein